jgi:hypothetical protein
MYRGLLVSTEVECSTQACIGQEQVVGTYGRYWSGATLVDRLVLTAHYMYLLEHTT